MKYTKILMIGCGGVGSNLLELWSHMKSPFKKYSITVIEPREINEYVLSLYPKLKHIKLAITQENQEKLLNNYLDNKTIMIDVSVNVDSIMLMKQCKKFNALFINTSIEDYQTKKKLPIEERTLYFRGLEADKLNKTADATLLHSNGMNPGLISAFVFYCLERYVKNLRDFKATKLLKDKKFNLLCNYLQLDTIHISEIDTQTTKLTSKPNTFINTWSAVGFQEESADMVQVAGNDGLKKTGFIESKIKKHIFYLKDRGMNVEHGSVCVDFNGNPVHYTGMMIPHYEPISLSEYLSNGEYCPNIYYVYKPSDIAHKSLNLFRENNYKLLVNDYVVNINDLINGSDNVGVTLYFKNGDIWWCGSCLSVEQVRKMGFKFASPTLLQVAISITTALEWLLKHQHKKVITSEEIPYNYMVDSCKPYLGNFYCKKLI